MICDTFPQWNVDVFTTQIIEYQRYQKWHFKSQTRPRPSFLWKLFMNHEKEKKKGSEMNWPVKRFGNHLKKSYGQKKEKRSSLRSSNVTDEDLTEPSWWINLAPTESFISKLLKYFLLNNVLGKELYQFIYVQSCFIFFKLFYYFILFFLEKWIIIVTTPPQDHQG